MIGYPKKHPKHKPNYFAGNRSNSAPTARRSGNKFQTLWIAAIAQSTQSSTSLLFTPHQLEQLTQLISHM